MFSFLFLHQCLTLLAFNAGSYRSKLLELETYLADAPFKSIILTSFESIRKRNIELFTRNHNLFTFLIINVRNLCALCVFRFSDEWTWNMLECDRARQRLQISLTAHSSFAAYSVAEAETNDSFSRIRTTRHISYVNRYKRTSWKVDFTNFRKSLL